MLDLSWYGARNRENEDWEQTENIPCILNGCLCDFFFFPFFKSEMFLSFYIFVHFLINLIGNEKETRYDFLNFNVPKQK